MKSFSKTIYLDNAATTAIRPEVLEVIVPHITATYGNPSSIHHQGRLAFDALEAARSSVAGSLCVSPSEIIFTCSGTEANNLAVLGVAHAVRPDLQESNGPKHLLISAIEHPSVLAVAEKLATLGFDIEYLPVDATGRIDVAGTIRRVRDNTILISVMLANNEIGTTEPIAELATALHHHFPTRRPLLHSDACQAAGQLPISPRQLGVDLMTLNSTKIGGPKGVGMFYARAGIPLAAQLVGGSQESGRRAGIENVPAIVGFARALELAIVEQPETNKRLTQLRDQVISALTSVLPKMVLNGHHAERLPNNIHLSLPRVEGESLLLLLDTYGICASTGSACNAHNLTPSHVLRAIGQSPDLIHGSLRLTLGKDTTEAELVETVMALKICNERLLAISPLHV